MPTRPRNSHSQRANSNTVDLQSRKGTMNLVLEPHLGLKAKRLA
jgi:hypothetical protein